MPPIARGELASVCEAAQPAAVAGFAAALFRARGVAVQQDSETSFILDRASGRERVGIPSDTIDVSDLDTVITAGQSEPVNIDSDTQRIDSEDLWHALLYAID